MMKIVLRAELNCERCRREAYEAISRVEGVESATVDIKEKKVTVIGDADPACLTMQLRRLGWAEIVSVGPNVQEAPKPMIKNPPKDDKKEAPPKKEAEVKNDSKKESEGKNGSKKEAKNPPPPKQDSSNKAQPQPLQLTQPLDVNVYVRGYPEEKPSYNQTLVIKGDCHHCCDHDVYFLSDENPNACSIC